jgi:hypothetical protein
VTEETKIKMEVTCPFCHEKIAIFREETGKYKYRKKCEHIIGACGFYGLKFKKDDKLAMRFFK